MRTYPVNILNITPDCGEVREDVPGCVECSRTCRYIAGSDSKTSPSRLSRQLELSQSP